MIQQQFLSQFSEYEPLLFNYYCHSNVRNTKKVTETQENL
jgi:hypothetical protein